MYYITRIKNEELNCDSYALYVFPKEDNTIFHPIYLGTLGSDLELAKKTASDRVPGADIGINDCLTVRNIENCGILDFGKYKGQYFEDILDIDPVYFSWMINNHNFYGQMYNIVNFYKKIMCDVNITKSNPPLQINTVVEFKDLTITLTEDMGPFKFGSKPTMKHTMKDNRGNIYIISTTVEKLEGKKFIVTGNFTTKNGTIYNKVKYFK